ncbi:hypothetical protein GPZ77_04340 [Streptomyces sp. QHH-9511]|uniref:non-homologous end-joining DNA ligase LigD n=1 Tax=Streptomyces sp. QHH-9511 TaxID=2684468 RepID=UPI001315BE21|nr:hypothetical protein [Streptomyces sp. QHH-9511]QGZ47716.1 hypothetical protein GPZ77_04340 [Streptomyces sp. QHH-9511]
MGGRTIESPSVLERHPDGIGDKGFTRKAVRDHFPDRVHRADLPEEHGVVTYAICDDTAAMVHLAGHTRVTPHRFLSQSDRRDPRTASSSTWTRRRTTSPSPGRPRRLHDLPDGFGLPSVVMITGSRGLRVLVPLDRRTPFDDVRALARPLAAPPRPGRCRRPRAHHLSAEPGRHRGPAQGRPLAGLPLARPLPRPGAPAARRPARLNGPRTPTTPSTYV